MAAIFEFLFPKLKPTFEPVAEQKVRLGPLVTSIKLSPWAQLKCSKILRQNSTLSLRPG